MLVLILVILERARTCRWRGHVAIRNATHPPHLHALCPADRLQISRSSSAEDCTVAAPAASAHCHDDAAGSTEYEGRASA